MAAKREFSCKKYFEDPLERWDNRNRKSPWVEEDLRKTGPKVIRNEGQFEPWGVESPSGIVGRLKACTATKDLVEGSKLHAYIREHKLLGKNTFIGSTLVNMYAKCGSLFKAQQVLKQLPARDVVTWNALIAGYAHESQGEQALKCFNDMICDGQSPTTVTFTCVLKACGSIGAAAKGEQIHDKIVSLGMLEKDVLLGTTLVDMYVKCGVLDKAQRVLKELPIRNVVSWNALLAGYAQQGLGEEALKCFDDMLQEGHSPDVVTFISVLRACENIGAATRGEDIHNKIVSLGMLEKDIVLGTALLNMYAKCGALTKAQQVLQELPARDVVSWSALIAGYAEQGQGEESLKCFDEMLHEGHCPDVVTFGCILKACGSIKAAAKGEEFHDKIVMFGMLEKNIVLGSSLVNMYAKCGGLDKAKQVLEELPLCDVTSWSALIAGYAEQGQGTNALKCFDDMLREGHSPTPVTFVYVLKACGSIRAAAKGKEFHDKIVILGMLEMLGSNLVDMYAKCGALVTAQRILEDLPIHNVVSWSALMIGYAEKGQDKKALECFDNMLREGLSPNAVTLVCVLKACGNIGSAAKGKEIHNKIAGLGILEKSDMLGNTLVSMYVKCGALHKAQEVLEELPIRDVVSWSALITGHVQKEQGEEALKCFDSMLHEGHSPDVVTCIYVLKACGSIGAVAKGEEIYEIIVSLGLLEKDIVLGTTLVEMYVRCGAIAKAQQLFEELPLRDVVSWGVLIAGYVEQGKGEEALKCFENMLHEGHSPDVATLICALKACASIKAASKGEEIHNMFVSLGMLEKHVVLRPTLVDMYTKCGAFAKAQGVLEEVPARDAVSWNALIAGYVQQGQDNEALKCFDSMLHEGHAPTEVTFTCALKACGGMGSVAKGKEVHDRIACLGILETDIVLWNALLDMYAKCGALSNVQRVFEEIPVHDVVSWTTLIAGYVQQGQGEEALKCFKNMLCEGHSPTAMTFAGVLKACASIRAAAKGKEIHDQIVSLGLLDNDSALKNALVDMYAKCGALSEAYHIFKELSIRNVVPFNALIAGYVEQGQVEEALKCFDDMLCEGLFPTVGTFAWVLKACGSTRAAAKGEEIHDEIVSLGMLDSHIALGAALVSMYVNCGVLAKAQRVLEELPIRDVVSWSVLIAGYAEHEQGEKALKCFDDMIHEGHSPTEVTFACVLKACGSIRAPAKGEEIHNKILRLGMLEKDVVLGTTLVDMYVKCGALARAQQVHEQLLFRDVISWSAIIGGYTDEGQGEEALKCYSHMLHEGLSPAVITFIHVLKACGSTGATVKGKQIHDMIISLGMLENNIILGTTLVDMYVKCGALAQALWVLEELPTRDVLSWSVIIAGYVQQGQGEEALKCFDDMLHEGHFPSVFTFVSVLKACGSSRAIAKGEEIHEKVFTLGMLEKDIVLGNSLVDMYVKCGALFKAQRTLKELPVRDVITWNSIIAGYVEHGQGEEALNCFNDMLHEGHSPTAVTFICVLKACGSIGACAEGEGIHDMIISLGMLEKDIALRDTLVGMYVKCGNLTKAQRVLEELPIRDVVSWSTLIAGYAAQGQGNEALKCFDDMLREGHSPTAVSFACTLKACASLGAVAKGENIHNMIVSLGMLEKDIVLGTTVVDMYVRCGALSKAQQVLEELAFRDAVTWSALIAGYAQQRQGEEALKCFDDMLREGHSPTVVTFVCALKACGSIGAAAKGKEIHDKIVHLGMLEKDVLLANALIDMYSKCGALTRAQRVLEELPISDVISWSALIAGYAHQGQTVEAINCFERMQSNGVKPNSITFISILNACSHSGLLNQAETYFSGMSTKYGVDPNLEHYCCITDLFGRAGKFSKALSVIAEMPSDKSLSGWITLLGACRKWGEVEIGRLAFEHAVLLDKSNAALYVLMADIYIGADMQEEADKIEIMRVANNALSRSGCSWWTDVTGNIPPARGIYECHV